MSIFTKTSTILITCPKYLSPYLRAEVEELEMPVREELVTGIQTEGTLLDAMRLNLHIRTGHRVLFLVDELRARDPEELYRRINRLPWEEYIDERGYMSVVSSVDTPTINNTLFANVKCKDAIVDRISAVKGRRPDSGPETNGTVIFLHWHGDRASVWIDTSGEPLARRGYRKIPFKAPMQESLAAAVILATVWKGSGNFVNPMCGSGTLAIEAALIALDKAPGLLRSNFGFMHVKGYDPEAWQELRREARAGAARQVDGRIVASDIDPNAVTAARKNAATAGVDHLIEFHVCDFSETPVPEGSGIVLLNPEYGARLGQTSALEETYRAIGDFFKQRCQGYTGYIFTGNPDLAKRVGLRTKRKIPFYNTTIECRLLEYELYAGTR
jgi:putative N6-adenine-specific DNA methylase